MASGNDKARLCFSGGHSIETERLAPGICILVPSRAKVTAVTSPKTASG